MVIHATKIIFFLQASSLEEFYLQEFSLEELENLYGTQKGLLRNVIQ